MIGSKAKSHANFSNLITYQMREDKCQEYITNNLFSEDPKGIAEEMELALKFANKDRADYHKIKTPTYHISFSWPEEDNPTNEQVFAVGQDFIEHMDLEDYQSVIAVHNDTGHKHIHVVANRVHPEGGELWQEWKWKDGPEGEKKCEATHHQRVEKFERMMEKEYGWRVEPGRHFGEWEKEFDGYAPTLSEIKRAEKVERVAGGMGMDNLDLRPVKVRAQELKEELYQAQSFKELDKVLNKNGLWIAAKGQGAVFTDEVYSVKASKVSRGLSGTKLEQRFGENLKGYAQQRDKQVDITHGKEQLKQWGHWYNQTIRKRILSESTNRLAVAKGELKEIGRYSQRITTSQEELKNHFLNAYYNSREAYGLVGKYIEIHGYDATDTQLRINPEQFGEISETGRIPDLRASIRDMEGVQNRFGQHIQSMSESARKKKTDELKSKIQVWQDVQRHVGKSGNNRRTNFKESRKKVREKYKDIKWLDWPKGEKPVFTFGKMKGKDIDQVIREDPDYIEWMKTQEFPQEILQILADRQSGKALGQIRTEQKEYLKRIEIKGKSVDSLYGIDKSFRKSSKYGKDIRLTEISNKVRAKMRESKGGHVIDKSTISMIAMSRVIKEGLQGGKAAPFTAGLEAWKQATNVLALNAQKTGGGKVAVSFLKGGTKAALHAANLISNPTGGSVKVMKSIIQSAARNIDSISRQPGRGR